MLERNIHDKTKIDNMVNVPKIKQTLKNALPVMGIKDVFLSIKKYLPEHAEKFNSLLLLEGRYRDIEQKMLQGVLSLDDIQLETNKIRADLLTLIDSLEDADFQEKTTVSTEPAKSKTGKILYRIPDTMQVNEESKCIIRVAFTEAILLEELEIESIDQIKSIRISEVMAAQIIDPNESQPFKIRTFSEEIQFVDEDYFTEWLFFVMPLLQGVFSLILKVSVIEIKMGKERKRDIVMEEKVVITTEAVAEEPPFKSADYDFVTPAAPMTGRGVEPPIPEPSIYPSPAPAKKSNRKMLSSLASVLLIIGVSLAMMIGINNGFDLNNGKEVASNDLPPRPKDFSAPPSVTDFSKTEREPEVAAMDEVSSQSITEYKEELIAYVDAYQTQASYAKKVASAKAEIQYLEYQEALLDSTSVEVLDYLNKYGKDTLTCLYCQQAEELKNYRLGKEHLIDFDQLNIPFETGKATIKNESYIVLRKIEEGLKRHSVYHLKIHGHTDDIGSEARNLKLSEARAKACYDYLVGQGIDANRLEYAGFGETIPTVPNDTEKGRSQNRRVEFNIQLIKL